jgi:hypothetical protein
MKAKSTRKKCHEIARIITMRELHRERFELKRMTLQIRHWAYCHSRNTSFSERVKQRMISVGKNPEFE